MEALPDDRPPLRYVIVADAVVFDASGEHVVMVRNRGRWWLPGGRVEAGETMFEAAAREVREETGLVVTPQRIVSLTERLAAEHQIFVTVLCSAVSGELAAPDADEKIDAVRWAPVAEAAARVPSVPVRQLATGTFHRAGYHVERPNSSRPEHRVHVLPDEAAVAVAAADHIVAALATAEGPVTLGLSGGGTPRATYRELAGRPVDWSRVTMWMSDERWVDANHPDSNEGMVRAALVGRVEGRFLAPEHSHGDPAKAAAEYAAAIAAEFTDRGSGPAPDIVLLGLGGDGHTASLFPRTPALEDFDHDYVANWVDERVSWRLTATLRLLWSAGELVFIVTGAAKAAVVHGVIEEHVPYPAQQVAAGARRVTWFLDEAAASRLTSR